MIRRVIKKEDHLLTRIIPHKYRLEPVLQPLREYVIVHRGMIVTLRSTFFLDPLCRKRSLHVGRVPPLPTLCYWITIFQRNKRSALRNGVGNDQPFTLARQMPHKVASILEERERAKRRMPLVYKTLVHVHDDMGSSVLFLFRDIGLANESMNTGDAFRS